TFRHQAPLPAGDPSRNMCALTRTPRPSPKTGSYDLSSWQYEGLTEAAGAGGRKVPKRCPRPEHSRSRAARAAGHGRAGATLEHVELQRDATLQHPSCVFQILKRHFARYTPAVVTQTCGGPEALF